MARLRDLTGDERRSLSPYLLGHIDNPVDWWPWCDEAFAEAKRRDVPVFLSIGYAACHWCHVMAHESFEDAATAEVLNRDFVSIKVDREERPDVDAVYMAAVQGLSGHGGWPMSVFLNPDRQPFHAGTYFPLEPRAGMPSFRQVLAAVSNTWVERRSDIDAGAAKITEALVAQQASTRGAAQALDRAELAAATGIAVQRLAHEFDPVNAGFGGAPKFPPSTVLRFLLRHYRRTGSREALAMADETCSAMARGGLYDQLGGGFARYSVDAEWVVPHFEKMLYDNALLLSVYTDLWAVTGSALAHRVVEETAEFLIRDLRTSEGAFASSLDADAVDPADGHEREGVSYVWSRQQLIDALGEEGGERAANLFGVTPQGTFEGGTSVLQLSEDPPTAELKAALLEVRSQRPQPARDDKVVTAWNGLAIAALANAGRRFDRPDWVAAAVVAANVLVELHIESDGGRASLSRVSRGGRATDQAPGVLEDYGDVAEGFLALFAVTGDDTWLTASGELLRTVLDEFRNANGGFFDTGAEGEQLIVRPSDPADLASPSGWSGATNALLTYGTLMASEEHLRAAEDGLSIAAKLGSQSPRFAGWLLAASEALLDGPTEVIIVGDPAEIAETRALVDAALKADRPGGVVVAGSPQAAATDGPFGNRPMIGGSATAYVCRGSHCFAPVATATEVQGLLEASVTT